VLIDSCAGNADLAESANPNPDLTVGAVAASRLFQRQ
jgi:hypothetical protein